MDVRESDLLLLVYQSQVIKAQEKRSIDAFYEETAEPVFVEKATRLVERIKQWLRTRQQDARSIQLSRSIQASAAAADQLK